MPTIKPSSSFPTTSEIDLLALDFDGVLTDNRVYVFQDGSEAVACNRADGMACEMIQAAGIPILILSTERNPVVSARAQKVKVDVLQGIRDKAAALVQFLAERKIDSQRVMYVGNDINDLSVMRIVGWPGMPADGHASMRSIVRFTTRARGGEGVVREIADLLNVGEWKS